MSAARPRPDEAALAGWLDRPRTVDSILALTGPRGAGKSHSVRRWASGRTGVAVVDCSLFGYMRLRRAEDIAARIRAESTSAETLVLDEPSYLSDSRSVFGMLAAKPLPRIVVATSSAGVLPVAASGLGRPVEEFRLRPEPDRKLAHAEIQRLWNTSLLRDIGGAGHMLNLRQAERLAQLLWDVRGDSISSRRLSDGLSVPGERLSPNSVEVYLRYLVDAYLVEKVPIFMRDKKRLCKSGFRYFFSDPALACGVFGPSPAEDVRHDGLNRAYLALAVRGGTVRVAANFGEEWRFVTGEPGPGQELWRFDGTRSIVSARGERIAW